MTKMTDLFSNAEVSQWNHLKFAAFFRMHRRDPLQLPCYRAERELHQRWTAEERPWAGKLSLRQGQALAREIWRAWGLAGRVYQPPLETMRKSRSGTVGQYRWIHRQPSYSKVRIMVAYRTPLTVIHEYVHAARQLTGKDYWGLHDEEFMGDVGWTLGKLYSEEAEVEYSALATVETMKEIGR